MNDGSGSTQPAKSLRRKRYGHFWPDPDRTGYENLVGTCRICHAHLVVNRATDLRGTYPSSGVPFRCSNCGRLLRSSGDIANHPVDQFVYDAHELLPDRRYMQVILLTAQSLELALVMCTTHALIGTVNRPKRLRQSSPYARLAADLEKAIDRLTLGTLRKLVANLALAPAPTTNAQAREAIAGLSKLQNKLPAQEQVATIASDDLREGVDRLLGLPNFVRLRNLIVHKAYRPTQRQAEWCLREIPKLTRALMRGFGVVRGQLVMPPTAG